jgi:hypothetical protein
MASIQGKKCAKRTIEKDPHPQVEFNERIMRYRKTKTILRTILFRSVQSSYAYLSHHEKKTRQKKK